MAERNSSPAIIFQANFEYEWHIGGYDFLEYMNRPEAFEKTSHLRDEYKDFIDYMSNTEKSDGLFDAATDLVSKEGLEHYRKLEEQSQSEGCPKYFGVISFRNDFLVEHGVMNLAGQLDVGFLKQLTREGMNTLISKSKKLEASNVYWNAAIHTNTDNVHIHYTLCEYHRLENRQAVYRDKDMLEQEAFNALKSKIVNRVMGSEFSKQLTDFERGVLLNGLQTSAPRCREQLMQLAAVLPPEGGWQYNRPKMLRYREQIDKCVMTIIQSNRELNSSYEEYIKKLDTRAVEYRDNIYGSNKTQLYLDYKRNRLKDFQARAGNIILKNIEGAGMHLLVRHQKSAHLSEERNAINPSGMEQSGTIAAPDMDRDFPEQPGTMAALDVDRDFPEQPGYTDDPLENLSDAELYEILGGADENRAHLSEEKRKIDLDETAMAPAIDKSVTMTQPAADDLSLYEAEKPQSAESAHLSEERKFFPSDGKENRALQLLEGIADSNPRVAYRLGKEHLSEERKDVSKAIRYFELASAEEQLKPYSDYQLARILLSDPDHRDGNRAVQLLKGISDNSDMANYLLGNLYYFGYKGIVKDRIQGIKYLTKAAEQGNQSALLQLRKIRSNKGGSLSKLHIKPLHFKSNLTRHTENMLRKICSDMKNEHTAAMREFERERQLNELRNRLY